MKTPDEIKKGLWCCSADCEWDNGCPYMGLFSECTEGLKSDALAYIQQLERERDAAVADLKSARSCRTCKNISKEPSEKPCSICGIAGRNYEWRGVKEDDHA